MNNIQDLIKELCPNGVEYKKIDELGTLFAGGTPKTSKKEYYNGEIPWLRSGEIKFNAIKTTEITITKLGLKESSAKLIKPYSVVIAMTGATVARSAWTEIEISANQSVCAIEVNNELNYKFLFYYLSSKYNDLRKSGKGVLSSLNITEIKNILIPVPPLEIQNKIVEILDKFSKYEAELEAELEARKKQYDYYLNLVFDRLKKNGGVLRKKIGDISTFYNGLNSKKAEHFKNGNSKYITYLNVFNNSSINLNELKLVQINKEEKQNKLIKGDVIFTNSSESKNEIGISSVVSNNVNFDLYLNSFCFFIRFNKDIQINPFFSKYLFRSTYVRKQIIKCCNGVTRFNLSKKNMKNIEIIIPPLKIQNKIVEVLDNFENICANLKIGLPKEIELRQKQYEYYRDKLLSFDILDNNIEREREREGKI